jgi:hypothetical protein
MLIIKGVFKKIKIGFILVEHAHNQIDQMFSCFSVKLAKSKAFVYDDLWEIIQQSYKPTPKICLLIETFDFRHYAFSESRITVNQLQNVCFCHQFKIEFAVEGDKVPTMWGKNISTHTDWAPEEEVKFLKEEIEERYLGSKCFASLQERGKNSTLP